MIDLEKTPIERWEGLPLWIKRDDRCHPLYGGNKPRKLARLLAQARGRGARRLVAVGAAGSHYALATALFGRLAGFEVTALLTPQPRSAHAVEVLRASVGQGVDARPVASAAQVAGALAAARGAWWTAPGGSSVEGSLAFVDAADELADAVARGEAPEPAWIVVAAGSGGTVAGLAAGLARRGLRSRVIGVAVGPALAIAGACKALTALTALRAGASVPGAVGRLRVDGSAVGGGYGHATAEGERAHDEAAERGISLDPTYTAKAMAVALRMAREGRGEVLFWHTLSSAPMAPLLVSAPTEAQLSPALRSLLRLALQGSAPKIVQNSRISPIEAFSMPRRSEMTVPSSQGHQRP